ncbi:7752_t:CDS:2 [Diversispora eburnea]|uniref:7752_t:CDS:1 n=1 Tax=Diversispora eburnea TaxID=1213867 RepID=A0A9N9FR57_9GLOM|nr:7752_t:CDS:2 [Diversispora eburnea]
MSTTTIQATYMNRSQGLSSSALKSLSDSLILLQKDINNYFTFKLHELRETNLDINEEENDDDELTKE